MSPLQASLCAAGIVVAAAVVIIALDRLMARRSLRIHFVVPGAGRRAERATVAGLGLVLEEIAAAVRAGLSMQLAISQAVDGPQPTRRALAPLARATERGQPLATSCIRWAADQTSDELRLVGAAMSLAADAGGRQALALDQAAATVRERLAVSAEVRAQSAQARLSAVVIGALPLVFVSWTSITDRRVAAFLFARPVGWLCLVSGGVLELLGVCWMRAILRSAR